MAEADGAIPFPFEPYETQRTLMRRLYDRIEKGGIGVFESPTGTGKSLSIICACLHYLRSTQAARGLEMARLRSSAAQESADWLADIASKVDDERRLARLERRAERLRTLEDRLDRMRARLRRRQPISAPRNSLGGPKGGPPREERSDADESAVLLDDYRSESSARSSDEDQSGSEGEGGAPTRVIYASRTHSQLAQFADEMRRVAHLFPHVRSCTIGSRRQLCVHEAVRRLPSDQALNDACLDLAEGRRPAGLTAAAASGAAEVENSNRKKARKIGCRFKSRSGSAAMADALLAEVRDVEEAHALGGEMGICPYYSARKAAADAEMILCPYQTLLSASAREAVGVDLRGAVVVFDEAHNVAAAASAATSVELRPASVDHALGALREYEARYRSRLRGKNLLYIAQLRRVLAALRSFFADQAGAGPAGEPEAAPDTPARAPLGAAGGTESPAPTPIGAPRSTPPAKSGSLKPPGSSPANRDAGKIVLDATDFVLRLRIDHLNLFKLLRYCDRSRIAHKLLGFQRRLRRESGAVGAEDGDASSHVSALQPTVELLRCLTRQSADGRLLWAPARSGRRTRAASLRFVSLNASVALEEITRSARCVLLVGGTLKPVQVLRAQLFPALPFDFERGSGAGSAPPGAGPAPIEHLSCAHVVPRENVKALQLGSGPAGVGLRLTHRRRSAPEVLDELARILLNVVRVTPGGTVAFLPSFAFEEALFGRWGATGALENIQTALGGKGRVHREPRRGKDLEPVLEAFAEDATRPGGKALLLSVVGGKLSEGINFKDDLARSVVMVGLPYADAEDPELKERIRHASEKVAPNERRRAATAFYQGLCMQSVNQSIGRAIRHAADFAAILLVDARYAAGDVRALLPGWIGEGLQEVAPGRFGSVVRELALFFRDRQAERS